jgi:hypothetical protein
VGGLPFPSTIELRAASKKAILRIGIPGKKENMAFSVEEKTQN